MFIVHKTMTDNCCKNVHWMREQITHQLTMSTKYPMSSDASADQGSIRKVCPTQVYQGSPQLPKVLPKIGQ